MTFANPWALLILLAAVPVVLLYRRRVQPERQTVTTDMFWQQALAEEPRRLAWRRWRERASLWVQLTLIGLAALAGADPLIPGPRLLTVIIDNSPGMAADVGQVASLPSSDNNEAIKAGWQPAPRASRLDVAKEKAREIIESLRSCDRMAVLTTEGGGTVACSETGDKRQLAEAIEGIDVGQVANLPLFQVMAGWQPAPQQILISDGCSPVAKAMLADSSAELLRVGTPVGNLAVTQLTARRTAVDPRTAQVLIEVQNRWEQSATCHVELMLDGRSIEKATMNVAADGVMQKFFDVPMPNGGRLISRVTPTDVYPVDNEASIEVPPVARYRVGPVDDAESALAKALKADPLVQLVDKQSLMLVKDEVGIGVFDDKTPEKLPSGRLLVVNPGPCDLWQIGDAVADPTIARTADDSILAGVQLTDAYLPGARHITLAESIASKARPLAWSADGTPLIYAIDRPEGRVIVIVGQLTDWTLADMPVLARLVSNSLDWLGRQPIRSIEPADGGIISPRPPLSERQAGEGPGVRAVDLRVPTDLGVDASSATFPRPRPPLWLWPAAVALAILVVEWCLYQRRWTN